MNAMQNAAPISPRTTAFRMTRPISISHFKRAATAMVIPSLPQRIISAIAAAIFGRKPTSPPLAAISTDGTENHEAHAWTSVVIHTDGSFSHVDGRMGWGAVISSTKRGDPDVLGALAGGSWGGNSALAEANAVAAALEALPIHTNHVLFLADCKNMLSTLRRAVNARSHGAFDGDGGLDLPTLDRIRLAATGKQIGFKWVKGHNGDLLNEAADILAAFGSGRSLPIHPLSQAEHPRSLATRIARLIEAPSP